MLKLRLSMGGTKKRPVYKIVVADSRFARDGRFIEKLGFFNPLLPKEKKLSKLNNPPIFSVEFFESQKNIKNINCYSNEGGKWEKSNIIFTNNTFNIKFRETFLPRRGRINCSLNEDGKWRWFGTQFVIAND